MIRSSKSKFCFVILVMREVNSPTVVQRKLRSFYNAKKVTFKLLNLKIEKRIQRKWTEQQARGQACEYNGRITELCGVPIARCVPWSKYRRWESIPMSIYYKIEARRRSLIVFWSIKMAAITHVYVCYFFTEQCDCHVTEYKLTRGDLQHAIIIGYFCVLSFHL